MKIPSLHTPILSVENLNTRHSKCTGQLKRTKDVCMYCTLYIRIRKFAIGVQVERMSYLMQDMSHIWACFSRRHKKSTYSIISGILYRYILWYPHVNVVVYVFAPMAKITLKRTRTKNDTRPHHHTTMMHYTSSTSSSSFQFRSFSQTPFSTVPLSAIWL